MTSLMRAPVSLALLLATFLWIYPASALAAHPTGAVTPDVAKAIGNPKLTLIECLDCHQTHGAADEGLLTGRDHAASACLNCHKGLDLGTHAGSHPMNMLVPRRSADVVLKLGGLLGPNSTIVCLSCHTSQR